LGNKAIDIVDAQCNHEDLLRKNFASI